MKNKKVLIAVAWPYVNGDIHIGHLAGYLFPADIYARFNRLIGNEVIMVSGSDCHGTPTTFEAEKRGVLPEDIVNEYHAKNRKLFLDTLKLSFDTYTKTTTDNHKEVVQDFFVRLTEKGFIFKDTKDQYYSENEKRFLPDRYVEGECPKCGHADARSDQCDNCGSLLEHGELINPRSKLTNTPAILKPTEHYFLDWPKLEPFLKRFVGESSGWRPWVLKETEGWLKEGLKARPITRDIDWGVEIPTSRLREDLRIDNSEHKRIYVWFDAVIGYLSATKEWANSNKKDWKDFWYGEDLTHAYFMGKDNLIFHTLFWPGELYGYDEKIHLPDRPFVNQFLNLEGKKFSKSRGITIDSEYIVKTYGLDPVRFYLTAISPESADTNFSWEDFVAKINDILIANVGNLVNRTFSLAKNTPSFDGKVIESEVSSELDKAFNKAREALSCGKFKEYVEIVLDFSDFGNKYLSKYEPWKIKKTDPERFVSVLTNALFIVLGLGSLFTPILPDTSDKIRRFAGLSGVDRWPINNPAEEFISSLSEVNTREVEPLFKKIEIEVVGIEKAKINTP